jgi:hypothetical protein
MANDVTQSTVRDPYAAYGDEVAARPFQGDLLRYTKHGEYKAGQDQVKVPEGTKMLAYLPSLKRGYVKWHDSMPVATVMGLVSEGYQPPPREELGDLDEDEWELLNDRPIDPWQVTNHLVMCDVEGNIYTFVSSSKGGLSAVGELSKAYAMRRRMKPDEIPVIELQGRSYIHKDYGETFAPQFKIIGWTKIPQNFTELSAAVDMDTSNDTLALEDLMGHEQEPEPVAQRPASRTAPQKPAPRTKAPPPKSVRGGNNGRRNRL